MTTFETVVTEQGAFGDGRSYYDFKDHQGESWRVITNHQPNSTKKLGYLTGCLTKSVTKARSINIYRPKLTIFLGGLVPGQIEPWDIKIKEEH